MSTRELLIEEINHAPEDVLQQLLRYLRAELKWRNGESRPPHPTTMGPYADYWNQFIGLFADEEWERPPQDLCLIRNKINDSQNLWRGRGAGQNARCVR